MSEGFDGRFEAFKSLHGGASAAGDREAVEALLPEGLALAAELAGDSDRGSDTDGINPDVAGALAGFADSTGEARTEAARALLKHGEGFKPARPRGAGAERQGRVSGAASPVGRTGRRRDESRHGRRSLRRGRDGQVCADGEPCAGTRKARGRQGWAAGRRAVRCAERRRAGLAGYLGGFGAGDAVAYRGGGESAAGC